MDKSTVRQWVRHNIEPDHYEKPDDVPVSYMRGHLIAEICKKARVRYLSHDPISSLSNAASLLSAEMPEGDIDRKTCMIYQFCYPDDAFLGSSHMDN